MLVDFFLVPRLQAMESDAVAGFGGLLSSYPRLTALVHRLIELPTIKAYYEGPEEVADVDGAL